MPEEPEGRLSTQSVTRLRRVEYRKRRARGAQWKRLRVRDGGSSTPGGIIRQAIRLTARARQHLGTDALWAWWNGYGLSGPKIGPQERARVRRPA